MYHAPQGVACFCLNQKYLSNAKVMIFWNVMQSLAADASVLDKKCYKRKEGMAWAVNMSEPIEMGARYRGKGRYQGKNSFISQKNIIFVMSTLSDAMFYGADQHVSRILLTFNDVLDYVLSHVCMVY